MNRTYVSGLKIHQLEERGTIPANLNWIHRGSGFPSSYSIILFRNEDKTKCIIACSDSFGGDISYAKIDGDVNLIGGQRGEFDKDELEFLQRKYPVFLEAIKGLEK